MKNYSYYIMDGYKKKFFVWVPYDLLVKGNRTYFHFPAISETKQSSEFCEKIHNGP